MKHSWTLVTLLLALALSGLALQAEAAPSLFGGTGLLFTPTADVVPDQQFNVAFFALELEEGVDESVLAANVGLPQGLELGFARIKPEGRESDTFLNAKYQLWREQDEKPALSVGVVDLTDEQDTTVYVVLSKSVSDWVRDRGKDITGPQIHAGLAGGLLDGVFAGASAYLGDKLALLAEYDTEDVNLGARLELGSGFLAHAGWVNGLDDFALGASFTKAY